MNKLILIVLSLLFLPSLRLHAGDSLVDVNDNEVILEVQRIEAKNYENYLQGKTHLNQYVFGFTPSDIAFVNDVLEIKEKNYVEYINSDGEGGTDYVHQFLSESEIVDINTTLVEFNTGGKDINPHGINVFYCFSSRYPYYIHRNIQDFRKTKDSRGMAAGVSLLATINAFQEMKVRAPQSLSFKYDHSIAQIVKLNETIFKVSKELTSQAVANAEFKKGNEVVIISAIEMQEIQGSFQIPPSTNNNSGTKELFNYLASTVDIAGARTMVRKTVWASLNDEALHNFLIEKRFSETSNKSGADYLIGRVINYYQRDVLFDPGQTFEPCNLSFNDIKLSVEAPFLHYQNDPLYEKVRQNPCVLFDADEWGDYIKYNELKFEGTSLYSEEYWTLATIPERLNAYEADVASIAVRLANNIRGGIYADYVVDGNTVLVDESSLCIDDYTPLEQIESVLANYRRHIQDYYPDRNKALYVMMTDLDYCLYGNALDLFKEDVMSYLKRLSNAPDLSSVDILLIPNFKPKLGEFSSVSVGSDYRSVYNYYCYFSENFSPPSIPVSHDVEIFDIFANFFKTIPKPHIRYTAMVLPGASTYNATVIPYKTVEPDSRTSARIVEYDLYMPKSTYTFSTYFTDDFKPSDAFYPVKPVLKYDKIDDYFYTYVYDKVTNTVAHTTVNTNNHYGNSELGAIRTYYFRINDETFFSGGHVERSDLTDAIIEYDECIVWDEAIRITAMVVSFVPIIGQVVDLGAAIYFGARGQWLEASLFTVTAFMPQLIPLVAKGARVVGKGVLRLADGTANLLGSFKWARSSGKIISRSAGDAFDFMRAAGSEINHVAMMDADLGMVYIKHHTVTGDIAVATLTQAQEVEMTFFIKNSKVVAGEYEQVIRVIKNEIPLPRALLPPGEVYSMAARYPAIAEDVATLLPKFSNDAMQMEVALERMILEDGSNAVAIREYLVAASTEEMAFISNASAVMGSDIAYSSRVTALKAVSAELQAGKSVDELRYGFYNASDKGEWIAGLGGNNLNKTIDELLINGSVPSVRNNAFNEWFDNLNLNELNLLWSDPKVQKIIKERIRYPGGLHEWCMVCETPKFKLWNVSMSEIKRFRTTISELKWTVPKDIPSIGGQYGSHGSTGSTVFHNELQKLITNSSSIIEFNDGLAELIIRWNIKPELIPALIYH